MEATASGFPTREGETPAEKPESEPTPAPEPTLSHEQEQIETKEKPWHEYISKELPRTVSESADTAIRSARSLHHNSSTHFRTLQDFIPQMVSQGRALENAFFNKVKDELILAKEHPFLAGGLALTSAMLLMRGPRRFLFRQTLGRFQSEEAQFVRAEKNVNELKLSVDLMKNESAKLLERAGLAEKEMKDGHSKLMNAGTQIRHLAKSASKIEAQATDLMDGLRELSGREALKLRAEVASMASLVRQQRIDVNKRIMKLSELGLPI